MGIKREGVRMAGAGRVSLCVDQANDNRAARAGAALRPRQKNTMPPKAKPFILASSPTTGFDVVRLTSPTSVTLLVSP